MTHQTFGLLHHQATGGRRQATDPERFTSRLSPLSSGHSPPASRLSPLASPLPPVACRLSPVSAISRSGHVLPSSRRAPPISDDDATARSHSSLQLSRPARRS